MKATSVVPTKKDIRELNQEVMKAFNEVIFDPLRRITGIQIVENSINDIIQDYRQGKIKFENGVLKGRFSVDSLKTLDSLNQQYDGNRKGFIITDANLQFQLGKEESTFLIAKTAAIALLKQFDVVSLGIPSTETNKIIDDVTDKAKTFTSQEGDLRVPLLSMDDVKKSFNNGINESFSNYSDLVIQKMERDLEQASNYKQLNDSISLRYQQTERKAHNMADDQSHFFAAEARRRVYIENGATSFVWRTKEDNDVRDSHKQLNGKIFSYNNPPIVDGVQSLPTEPFGCRCIDIPIFKSKKQADAANEQLTALGL